MYSNIRHTHLTLATVAGLLFTAASAFGQGSTVGQTQFPIDGFNRFVSVAYDAVNNVYLVAHGHGSVTARYISADGVPLGQPVTLNTAAPGASRVACGGSPNVCLVAWLQEPSTVMGRLVSYGAGAVVPLGAPFVVVSNGITKYPEAAPAVAYSPVGGGEFLVVWTEGNLRIRGRLVTKAGVPVGTTDTLIAHHYAYQFFPSATYNTQANEYVIGYQAEDGNSSLVAGQRVAPGTGQPIGLPSVLLESSNEKYPEIAYNSTNNTFLATSWHEGGTGNWFIHGRIANGDLTPTGSTLLLASNSGGIGIGLAYNPVSNTYLGVHQNPFSDAITGVIVSSQGAPSSSFQVMGFPSMQPESKVAASTATGRFLAVSSYRFRAVMTQLVQSSGSTSSAPAAPTLVSPAGSSATNSPTFTWNASAGATYYHLWVNDVVSNKVKVWYTAAQAGCAAGTGTCAITPGATLANGPVKWWVQAWNPSGYSAWSSPLTFSVGITAPTLIAPNGAVSSAPVTFSWTAVGGASYYHLWVNDNHGPKYRVWYTAAAVGCSGGGTCSVPVTFHPAPLAAGIGLWWVQAWSPSAGYGPWSSMATFSSTALTAPQLLTPSGGAVGATIEFGWFPVSGADYYLLWVNDTTGNKLQQWFTAAQASCPGGAGLCIVNVSPTLASGSGAWWVQAWSGIVGYGPWSSPLYFLK